ncbi:outer membrane beta-barrel protein [uncultured Alistipes sp.]|uniref:outer membrane beta-barrel protein n=1 Tax=uncultured Alistipes sp. TaxID=538949 RepID=UPI00262910AE|nr:outer membrane beta-barrel protein [uncultured Alistipes sp.]
MFAGGFYAASAQDKGFFVELSAGHNKFAYDVYGGSNSHTFVTPAVGYRFANNWSVGVRVQLETKNYWDYENFTAIGVFGQYRFFNAGRLSLFAEAQLSCYMVEHDYVKLLVSGGSVGEWAADHPEIVSDNFAEAGFTFGASYRIWKGLAVTACYLYLGYSGSPAFRRSGGCWGDGDFVLDAGWNRLQVGLQYTF